MAAMRADRQKALCTYQYLDAPTMAAPAVIKMIPIQWCRCSLLFSSTIVKKPAKTTMVPRSI
jgi:hypothetical protein